jgi:hypothetical protein
MSQKKAVFMDVLLVGANRRRVNPIGVEQEKTVETEMGEQLF